MTNPSPPPDARQGPALRATILDVLGLFASEERQWAYQKNVPSVDIALEMPCAWFDDLYHPDDALFRSCFSDEEQSALSQFSEFYRERTAALPESGGTIRTWLEHPVWQEVMTKAGQTFDRIAALSG